MKLIKLIDEFWDASNLDMSSSIPHNFQQAPLDKL
jgi:hypothetical protein